jgi:eukaryotic-like serine/threonine-protein kinase
MSENHSARDSDVGPEPLDDDVDESVIADRAPRAPSIQRLGRYRLVREIASGGMASVNLAVTEGLDKLVALKIIHPHLAQEESFVRMFLDEARLASAITHRNVCNVFDFGETDGRFYIAMDYLSGQSLRDVLRRLRKVDLQMEPRRIAVYVAYMLAEACEGLHAAHELHSSEGKPLNVVHRDVSPHNLFVTYDGNVSVVDFGIARASDRIQNTATGVLKGKFSYMAPEQMRQLEIDRRADIWALGVVLWESLTLQRLFVRSSQADTVMSVMMDRVRPPSEIKPDLPKELDAIVLKAISRSPAQRYTTAREMGRELMKFCRESGVMVSPIEIEHLMERLFEKEIFDSKQLMRKAKQSGNESGVWMEVTPSGFGRVSMRASGSLDKGQWTNGGVDVVGEGSQSTSKRMIPNSVGAPTAEARATAAPDVTSSPKPASKKPIAIAAALAACALVSGTYFLTRQSRPSSEQIAMRAPMVQEDRVGAVAPTPSPSLPEPAPSTKQQPSTDEREPSLEPPTPRTEPEPARGNAPVQRAEPPRRDMRARPVQRGAQASQAAQRDQREERDADSPGPARSGAEEPVARAPEPVTTPAPAAQEHREEATAPVAQPAQAAAPAAPAQVVAKPAVVPSAPAAPQRLDAQASIADLDVEGSLGTGVVGRMLGRVTPALKACYVDAAKRANRNDFTGLAVSLVIDEGGAVRQLNVGRHGLSDLTPCASNALKRLRSERVPDVGTVQVKFRVAFTP